MRLDMEMTRRQQGCSSEGAGCILVPVNASLAVRD
jgi:hypothetical protein